jgi:tetratricopeptide (TPR) repeat protein
MMRLSIILSAALFWLGGCAGVKTDVSASVSPFDVRGQLFDDLGNYDRAFTTTSAEANEFMVQGMIWVQSFNHDEAVRSFKEAARLDPESAMAWWGIAYAAGPNYIAPFMTPDAQELSWLSVRNAVGRIENTTEVERGLILAMAERYDDSFSDDRAHLDQAYADAMGQLWDRFPDDPDVGVLYAEARMILRPNRLYDDDLQPVDGTAEIVADLEHVLTYAPDHPGACHMHIHSLELSAEPARALPSADQLATLVPASGHMLHMPTHIYIHTNRWDRAVDLNAQAMRADDRYRERSTGHWTQHLYMLHNNHLLVFAAMMSGREREAMYAARRMWADLPDDQMESLAPLLDRWMCAVYDVQKRFGRWQDLLEEPAPPSVMPISTCMWRAHRAVAYAALKEFDAAEREYGAFEDAYASLAPELLAPGQSLQAVRGRLEVIRHFVPAEIALQQERFDAAITHLLKAVDVEDSLGFNGEPPDYMQPIRHTLGAVYLKARRFEDAERTFREDLSTFPGNGWSLYGLSRTLREQGRVEEAQIVEDELGQAWAKADEPLTTSCRCIPDV